MGYRKTLDPNNIVNQLRSAYREINSGYNDGFIGWQTKRELYEIKWILDEILKESSTFGEIEQRYLDEIEKHKIIRELKK